MKFILAKKLKMSQVFDQEGRVIPVTIVEAGPVKITNIRTKEKNGYEAVQLGFGYRKKLSQPLKGILKGLGNFRWLREIKLPEAEKKYKIGDEIKVEVFQEGDVVTVTGISKSKGFQGVVKRHGFHGSDATHGTKDRLRAPGSIGATNPQRVPKGRRMAGRMGGERVTVKNLKIIKIDKENNLLYIKGAVPGIKGSLLIIKGK